MSISQKCPFVNTHGSYITWPNIQAHLPLTKPERAREKVRCYEFYLKSFDIVKIEETAPFAVAFDIVCLLDFSFSM